jgi:hypothetical protein
MREVTKEAIQRLYWACRRKEDFPGDIPDESTGEITTDSILRGLGLIDSSGLSQVLSNDPIQPTSKPNDILPTAQTSYCATTSQMPPTPTNMNMQDQLEGIISQPSPSVHTPSTKVTGPKAEFVSKEHVLGPFFGIDVSLQMTPGTLATVPKSLESVFKPLKCNMHGTTGCCHVLDFQYQHNQQATMVDAFLEGWLSTVD